MRTCFNCGSDKTYIYKRNNRPSPVERWYNIDNEWFCEKCRARLFSNPIANKKWNPIKSKQSLRFKGRKILLKHNPRTGVCSLCRKQGKTHMHHMKYHDDDVLRDTIEVCISCHNREHHQY